MKEIFVMVLMKIFSNICFYFFIRRILKLFDREQKRSKSDGAKSGEYGDSLAIVLGIDGKAIRSRRHLLLQGMQMSHYGRLIC